MSDQELILYEKKGRTATITLNRPDKANSCNSTMLEAIYNGLEDADKDEKIRCILIKAAGDRFFSAGYDLKEIQGNPENMTKITTWGRKVNQKIMLMKTPVITMVQGAAIGFGMLLIMASDLRIFADRPKEELYVRLPELQISAFPQTGATLMTLLAFGSSYAKYLLYSGDKVGVEELKNIGFPTRVFPYDKLEDETRSFVRMLTKYQPEFLYFPKVMLTLMNKAYIKRCLDMEDECGKVTYQRPKKSFEELHEFIESLYDKYP